MGNKKESVRKGENGQMNVESGQEKKIVFEYLCMYKFKLMK